MNCFPPAPLPAARRVNRFARMAAVAGMSAFMAFSAIAQDGTGPVPENAEARSYGDGWNCALGYRVDGAECLPVEVPENAYATWRSYCPGCAPISVPANAFLRSYGYGWQCERGYRQDR